MPYAAAPDDARQARATKFAAALSSTLAALGITLLKLATGLWTGSLGMLSEAAHSAIDLVASTMTLFSVRVSDRPADEDHNYGHGKIESLSAFVETGLMLGSSVLIVTEAVRRIVFKERLALTFSIAPFVVLLLSLLVDFTRSRKLARVAAEHRSDALEADALHFRTDMWASSAVLIGLAATYAGEHWRIPALRYADPLAGMAVAGVILYITWKLTRKTIDSLLDAAPRETRARMSRELTRDLESIDGVLAVSRIRTRRAGANYFADLTLELPRSLSFQRSEQITIAATEAVRRHLPDADVVVHSIPTATLAENVHDRIRAVALRLNLQIHDVAVQALGHEQLHVEQDLEVDETMTMRQAHDVVTQLESEIQKEIPEITSILTHIESLPATIEKPASLERSREIETRLRRAASRFPEILDIHDVIVMRLGSTGIHLQVNCHCTLPDDLPMGRVHSVITALEGAFRLEAPEVDRLFIHPEPATDNRR